MIFERPHTDLISSLLDQRLVDLVSTLIHVGTYGSTSLQHL